MRRTGHPSCSRPARRAIETHVDQQAGFTRVNSAANPSAAARIAHRLHARRNQCASPGNESTAGAHAYSSAIRAERHA
ncbi:hypothetical protein WT37_09430 [Burkholderia territorii]|nr:hypothetical protein WT37_09430 [Burkholderia territorii]